MRRPRATIVMTNLFIALSITQRPHLTHGLDGALPRAAPDLCRQSPSKWLESAGVSQRPLDVDLRHPLAPVMTEVRIVERSRRLVSRLGDLSDQVLGRAGALQWREERGDIDGVRTHGAQRTTSRAHRAVIPADRDRHAEDRKVKGRAAAEFPVGAGHPAARGGELAPGGGLDRLPCGGAVPP